MSEHESAQALAQRILDGDGYLVLSWDRALKPGDVVYDAIVVDRDKGSFEHSGLRVLAEATVAEWAEQIAKYHGRTGRRDPRHPFLYRMVAE